MKRLFPTSLRIFLIWKALLVYAFLMAFWSMPRIDRHKNHHYADEDEIGFLVSFINWDGQHYLDLAENGYPEKIQPSTAFYPLLPGLIRLGSYITQSTLWSALLISTFLAFGFIAAYWKYVASDYGEKHATSAAMLALSFPTMFFLNCVYSEGLFLFLLFAFLLAWNKRSWWIVLAALLLPAARATSLFALGGLMATVALDWFFAKKKPDWTYLAGVLTAFALGFAALLFFHWQLSGDPFAPFSAQRRFVFKNSVWNLLDPTHFFSYMTTNSLSVYAFTESIVDKLFIVFMLATPILLWRKMTMLERMMYLSLALPPALMGLGGSYARFALVPFAFAVPAIVRWLEHKPRALVCVGVALLVAQMVFVMRFVNNLWVG